MSSREWKEIKLGDYINIKHGYAFKGEFFSETETDDILVTPGNFKIGGGFKEDKLKYYNGECPEEYVLKPNDIIVTMTDLSKMGDTLGYSALVPHNEKKRYLHNQRIGLVEFPSQAVNPSFIYWRLRSNDYQKFTVGSASGSTVKHTSPKTIKSFKFKLPPLPEQHAIAATLSCIDDLIELNNRTNQVLEEMAQAIFKHWFVDFEFPNEDGQPYKSSGGAMVDSELGEIPEGWGVGNFTDIVEVCGGGTPKTRVAKYWNGEIPFFTPKDSTTNYYVIDTEKHLTETGVENCNSQLYPENTVFITARGTVGKINLSARPMAMNQSCYALKSRNEFNPFFVHQLAINTVKALKYKANGAVFNAIVTRDFDSERIVISPNDCIKRFEIHIKPLYDLMRDNVIENQTLTSIRNTLLPKLMSGEIRVPVEEVV